jgi:hypothetical protein
LLQSDESDDDTPNLTEQAHQYDMEDVIHDFGKDCFSALPEHRTFPGQPLTQLCDSKQVESVDNQFYQADSEDHSSDDDHSDFLDDEDDHVGPLQKTGLNTYLHVRPAEVVDLVGPLKSDTNANPVVTGVTYDDEVQIVEPPLKKHCPPPQDKNYESSLLYDSDGGFVMERFLRNPLGRCISTAEMSVEVYKLKKATWEKELEEK